MASEFRDPDGTPLLTVARRRVGVRSAWKVLAFLVTWDHARDQVEHDGELTIEQYAAFWEEDRASAFRKQALFREAFPGEKTPSRLLDLAAEQANTRTATASLGRTLIPS